ncbi:hypothetical protein CBM2598_U10120 [Cupriavidus taiwanensis]|nr:hypothetical protein CBM2598_U10120 [Cupriavidus taiwanensis]
MVDCVVIRSATQLCELGIGLLLAMLRKMPRADDYVRSVKWQNGAYSCLGRWSDRESIER